MTPPPPPIRTAADLLAWCHERASDRTRRIIGVTGPPGSGKSSFARALTRELRGRAVSLPMDGFHLANGVLIALGRRERKGAPDTFDVAGYTAVLQRVRAASDPVVYAPLFDRSQETAIAAALPIPSDIPLVVTEGNYLLHRGQGWERVRPLLDAVWYLDVPEPELQRRLIARRMEHGESAQKARAWVENVDLPNARLVALTKARADVIVRG